MEIKDLRATTSIVTPAKAGVHGVGVSSWIPAFAGVTG